MVHAKTSISGKDIRTTQFTPALFLAPAVKKVFVASKCHDAQNPVPLVLFKLMAHIVAIVVRRVWTERALAQAKMTVGANEPRDDRFSLRVHDLCTVGNLCLSR